METQDDPIVPPASVEQGAESQPAPAANETEPTFDTQAVLDKVKDVFLPEEPEPPKEEPKASETPPAPEAVTPEAKAPEEKAPDANEAEDAEDALLADPPELDRKDPRLEKIGKRLDRLREKNAALRQDAAFGSTLVKMAKDGNMSPDQLAWWNALGVRANMGDPQAIQEMAGVLQGLGWKPPQSAPVQTESGVLDATAEKIYQEVFSDDVKNLNIDEDLAKAKARKLAERELAGRTPQPPPPQPVQQYQPPAQVPPQQPQRQADPLASAVAHSLHERQQRFAASIPGFDQINAEVVKRIKALGPEKVPLIDRPSHYESLVLQVQRERAATKRTPPPSTGLRSSTMAAPNKSSTKEKILNDPEIWGQ
jgi:hypothetical protein